jgi:hypothetical protein
LVFRPVFVPLIAQASYLSPAAHHPPASGVSTGAAIASCATWSDCQYQPCRLSRRFTLPWSIMTSSRQLGTFGTPRRELAGMALNVLHETL